MSNNPFYPKNHSLIGNNPPHLLRCDICNSSLSVCITDPAVPSMSWLTTLKCTKDKTHLSWSVCRLCTNNRIQYKTNTQIKKHNKNFHKPKHSVVTLQNQTLKRNINELHNYDNDDFSTNNSTGFSFADLDDQDELLSKKEHQSTIHFDFSNQACNDFFTHEYNNGNGDSYLVSNACFNGDVPPSSIHDDEKKLILLITNLSMLLTRDQYSLLTSILVLLEDVVKRRCKTKEKEQYYTSNGKSHFVNNEFNKYNTVQIPKTVTQLQSITNKRKKSILQSLPIPEIETIGDHTYLSIINIISDVLAHGYKIAKISAPKNENISTLCTSPFVTKLDQRGNILHDGYPLITLFIIEWSDDFEPNKMKSNRNSIWLKTVTISPVHGLSKNSHHNTYPLSFGPKNSCHEMVEARFKEDLKQLKNGSTKLFYNGYSKSMYRVHAELIISIQDQPERRGKNHVALGKSNFTPRWGYLLNVNQVRDKIIPCNKCETILFLSENKQNTFKELQSCKQCTSWDYVTKKDMLVSQAPEKYPSDYPDLYNSKKIFPKEQTFQQLIDATAIVHEKRVNGLWNIEESRAFMQTEGLNTRTQNTILFNAANCTVETILEEVDESVRLGFLREKSLAPDSFKVWTCASWTRDVQIWQHVEAVMHLVFHGVQKTNMILIESWASRCGLLSALKRFGNVILQNIQELNLEWCKLIPYNGGKFGGWMAEIFLGMARINCWFYSMLHTLPKETKYNGDPTTCQTKWNKKENTAWLQARGLPAKTKQTASELSCIVATYLLSDEIPQVLQPTTYTAEHIQDLVYHASLMINLIMNKVVNTEYLFQLDCSIKIFLTKFNKFAKNIQIKKNDKPQWIASYNYLCLLNLSRIAENFGPLCNMWEGGYIGEGYLRLVKPYITRGTNKNWQKNVHRGLLQRKIFNYICKDFLEKDITQPKQYHKYTCVGEINAKLVQNKVLSCIYLSDGTFLCVMKDKTVVPLLIGTFHGTYNYLHYFIMKIGNSSMNYTLQDICIMSYCLLLPKLDTNGLPNGMTSEIGSSIYTVVSSDWKQLQKTKLIK